MLSGMAWSLVHEAGAAGRAEAGGVGATRAIERERRTQSLASRGTPGPGRRGHLYVEVTAMVVSGVGGGRG